MDKIKVQFCTQHHPRLFFRQSPQGDGVWKDIQFVISNTHCAAEWLVCFDEPVSGSVTNIPIERRILFITEPSDAKFYSPRYLSQFGIVVSPRSLMAYEGRHIQRHGSLPWHYASDKTMPDWETNSAGFQGLMSSPVKHFNLSVICSHNATIIEQQRRILFISELKSIMQGDLHWFGKGFSYVGDKFAAIAPYRFHIVLENTMQDHAWTEKPSDCFLGEAFAFYSGPKNLGEYFPEQAFASIDTSQPREMAGLISTIISEGYEHRRPHIMEAKQRVLYKYNIFEEVYQIILNSPPMDMTSSNHLCTLERC